MASITVSVNAKSIAKNLRSNTTVINTLALQREVTILCFLKQLTFHACTHRGMHIPTSTQWHTPPLAPHPTPSFPPPTPFTYFSVWFKTTGWDEHSKELYDYEENIFTKCAQYVMIWGTLFLTVCCQHCQWELVWPWSPLHVRTEAVAWGPACVTTHNKNFQLLGFWANPKREVTDGCHTHDKGHHPWGLTHYHTMWHASNPRRIKSTKVRSSVFNFRIKSTKLISPNESESNKLTI